MAEPEETKSDEDLTMEEILSSIRKIISEDEEASGDSEAEAEAEAETEVEMAEVEEAEAVAEPEPAPEPEPEPEPAEVEASPAEEAAEVEDVLDLTDVIEEEVEDEVELEDVELSDEPEPAAPEPAPPEPVEEVEIAMEEEPFPKGEGLLSSDAAQRTSDIIDQLAVTLTSGYEGDGRTLEGLVKAMLKPMLKEWLDANLPDIVQRSVEAEIARLTRYNK